MKKRLILKRIVEGRKDSTIGHDAYSKPKKGKSPWGNFIRSRLIHSIVEVEWFI